MCHSKLLLLKRPKQGLPLRWGILLQSKLLFFFLKSEALLFCLATVKVFRFDDEKKWNLSARSPKEKKKEMGSRKLLEMGKKRERVKPLNVKHTQMNPRWICHSSSHIKWAGGILKKKILLLYSFCLLSLEWKGDEYEVKAMDDIPSSVYFKPYSGNICQA